MWSWSVDYMLISQFHEKIVRHICTFSRKFLFEKHNGIFLARWIKPDSWHIQCHLWPHSRPILAQVLVIQKYYTLTPTIFWKFQKGVQSSKNKYLVIKFTVEWGTNAQCFCPLYLKTWFFYVVVNAELNGTVRILCFHRAIIDLLWPSLALLCNSRSIMAQRKHKILMVPLNSASALKTT